MRRILLPLAAVAALSFPAEAGWKQLNGRPAPDFTAKTWLLTGKLKPTKASLRGKVYLVEFFATW